MEHVGTRLRRWRLRRGLSQRVLAELAGFSQGYVAQIESGTAPLERRAARESLARALQISVGELTGRTDDGTPESPVGAAAVAGLRAGIVALAVPVVTGGEPSTAGDVDTATLDRFYGACRYDLLVPALAEALTVLGSRAAAGAAGRCHLRRVVEVCSTTVATCVQLGHPDLTLAPAGMAMRAAEDLGEPAYLGLANYARIRAVGTTAGADRVVGDGIERLSRYAGANPVTAGTYGMHHLIAAEMAARAGRAEAATAHLDEAAAVAAFTGERADDWFSFGPTNVGMWRLAVLVALGDGVAARTPMPGFHPESLPSAQRRATYFIDLSRALLQGRGLEDPAVTALYRAEMIAPQQVCASDGAREALRTLLSRPRFGRDGRLRGLAGRAGIRD
ncbi:helix-turn-helix transcriptional regulator [Actinoplanes sichuanensis]|uniref:Helix-turn-helix domain-containing protein n=1 Tax=Actinoplanes sichuanensis TaxID=512349 RepID=A0ABW4ACL7_9ACTN|nr:helix-turn-helix transcriptional regulator [Actinoplanes sichuanensis]BEL08679.1 helix-turn-helix transcriptional regulator [Actinoplanes sichuanensis]